MEFSAGLLVYVSPMKVEIPSCPKHGDAKVRRISRAGTDRSMWICSTCWVDLGDAGERIEAKWERDE